MENIRVRFAPSPTGPLHIGGARSALFNYLLAKKHNGTFVVRIEDTDLERSSRESEKNILDALRWVGITWDEGIEAGGGYGPYRQTERLDLYREYADRLVAEGRAYYCYCTPAELENEREELLARNEMPVYGGHCRDLSAEQKEAFESEGRKPVVRFRVPEDGDLVLDDMVRGKVSFDSAGVGDFVIMKSDGIPTYNFAVVIDDHLMEISHVIRGEEHLSNTPRQLVLYNAFGWEAPVFAHISLILGSDRKKMSKRDGATAVFQYRDAGYLPEALVNFLALLGWSPGGEEEIFDMETLVREFSLDHVAKNPAVFDFEKLKWINGIYIRKLSEEELAAKLLPVLRGEGVLGNEELTDAETDWLNAFAGTVREKINFLNEAGDFLPLVCGERLVLENAEAEEVLKGETVRTVLEAFGTKLGETEDWNAAEIKAAIKKVQKETGIKGKNLFMPIRVAVTGQVHGPDIDRLIMLMGRKRAEARLAEALEIIS